MRARPTVAPYTFRVTGQYHHLSDSVSIGSSPQSDFVLADSTALPSAVVVAYDPASEGINVRVVSSVAPVLLGTTPVNALRLGRTTVVAGDGPALTITRPWWCWYRCATRRVAVAGRPIREASTDTTSFLRVGTGTVVLFRAGGYDYIGGDPSSGITVRGKAIPASLTVSPDTLRIGKGRSSGIELRPNVAEQRLDLRLADHVRGRWDLEPSGTDTTRYLVAATRGGNLPGTTKLINPAAVAPGAATVPYGGILEYADGAWQWSWHATTRRLATGTDEMLPGPTNRAGHLVSIDQHDTEPSSGRRAAAFAWIVGVLLLAWVWRDLDAMGASGRVITAGLVYTLIFIRGSLAFRAWLAPPNNTSAVMTFFALLIAVPAMAAACHIWQDASHSAAPRTRRPRTLLLALPVVLQVLIALCAVLLSVAPAWRYDIVIAALSPLGIGIVGLAFLQRVLATRKPGEMLPGPLAALEPGHVERGTFTGFASAVAVLAVLGALIPVASRLVRGGTALALIAWFALAGMILLLGSMKHVFIKRRSPRRRIAPTAALGLVTGMAVFSVTRNVWLAIAALAFMSGAGWLWFGRRGPRIRPVHLYDLLPPSFLVTLLIGAAVVITLGVVRPLAVAGEYAIALGGLLVFVRIFAVLWFRIAERRTRQSTGRAAGPRKLPGIWAVFAALLAGMVVFAPLAADPGLLMLFLSAAILAAVVGMATLGSRGAIAGVTLSVALGLTFFLGMWVRPASLTGTSKPLQTAEIRYAAVYHPQELESRLMHARGSEPFVIVNTLQQYWGMRNYTALAGTSGQGYFRTDFTNRGTKEAVALTDNAFSVFVLSEHGWIGGVAVLLVYLLLGCMLLNGALHNCERRAHVPRGILLVGIAAFWLVPTLYLAAANGLLVPLTGQNIPMLGLLSNADVAMASWLSALGLLALPATSAAGEEYIHASGSLRSMRRAIRGMALTFTVLACVIAALLWRPTHGVYGDFRLDTLVGKVEELAALGALVPVATQEGADTIAVAASAASLPALRSGAFLSRMLRRSNEIARSGRTGGSCYEADALLRVSDEGGVIVFPSLCRIQAVTDAAFPWRGHMRTQAGVAELVVSDGRTSVAVAADAGEAMAVIGGGCSESGIRRARSVQLGCAKGAPVLQPGAKLYVLRNGGPGVLVNGLETGALALVSPGDRVRVNNEVDVIADTVPAGALAYARWINGTWRRLTPTNGSPLLAQVDSQLARGLSGRDHSELDAMLTLNRHVHEQLQQRLSDACRALPNARRCSVVLADPQTGAIRALAQYPLGQTPPRDLPADANLRNHPAASAVKPLLAAAALDAYPRLVNLEVEHTLSVYTTIANADLGAPFDAHRLYPGARVPFSAFLPASDNVFAATLGFLAASERGDAGLPARNGGSNDSRLSVDGRALSGRPAWKTKGGRMSIGESPFAVSLEKLYAVHAVAKDAPTIDDRFWKGAVDKGYMRGTFELQRITPEPVILKLEEVQTPRMLATFMIGGGTDRWNNVSMTEAVSRIFTGRRVALHLLRSIGDDTLSGLPDSLPGMAAVRDAVLDGMRGVVTLPYATAGVLRSEFGANGLDWIGKTGTLKERDWTGSLFLFAGAAKTQTSTICAVAGVLTIEFASGGDPDGKATAFFSDAIAPLLRQELGWGDKPCRAR
ncbi:MAG: hypothetical protein ABIS27_01365 [Longimicrobiales bacterium]